jgi:enamine deaminase RidA (YjgF/YER057c/UK114 family)
MSRRNISSGSPFETEIGFSRAVRLGPLIVVAGTAPIDPAGGTACPGDVYGQTRRCLEIVAAAINEAGGAIENTIRTRILLTDISRWREAARAHGEMFGAIRPACTFLEVSRFIDPDWLVEIEADCAIV